MRFSRSTHLQMCLSSETLTSIISASLPILVEKMDLVNSVIIFLSQMTILIWTPTRIPDCNSDSPALLNFFLSSDTSNFSTMAFSDLTCHLEDKGITIFWLHCAA